MFNTIDQNVFYLKRSFNKLKSYYYYNKNMLFIKMKIAEFELSSEYEEKFIEMANYLSNPNIEYVQKLVNQLSYRLMSKKIIDEHENDINDKKNVVLLSNVYKSNREIQDVNFVIDAPIEVYILDTLWTVILAKIFDKVNHENDSIYANIPSRNLFIDGSDKDILQSINWDNGVIFDNYYVNYCKWRDKAFLTMKEMYNDNKDSLLFTLDLKSYFYRVIFSTEKFKSIIGKENENFIDNNLSILMLKVMNNYTRLIKKYLPKDIKADHQKNESIFPIGLLSSLILSNLYLDSFDKDIVKINPKYYGRYVDDILIVKRVNKRDAKKEIDDLNYNFEELHRDNLLEHITLNSPLNIDGDDIKIKSNPNLIIQKDKVRCLHVSSSNETSIFNLYEELFKSKPSILNQSMDFDLLLTDFDRYSQYFDIKERTPKVRDFAYLKPQHNKAKTYIDNAIRCVIGTHLDDNSEESIIVQRNIDEIKAFYDDENSLQDVAVWQSLFYFFAVTNKAKDAHRLYKTAFRTLQRSNTYNFSLEKYSKFRAHLHKKAKRDLVEELEISYALSIALNLEKIKEEEIFKKALILRKSNIFRNDLVLYPLLNYSSLYKHEDFSYILYNDFSKKKPEYKLDDKLLQNKPRFINLGELYLYHFYSSYYNNLPYLETKDLYDIEKRFLSINSIYASSLSVEYKTETSPDNYKINTITIKKPPKLTASYEKLFDGTMKCAVASVKLDKKEVIDSINKPEKYLNIKNKARVFKLVNDAIKNKASILVFPEYYLPKEWIMQLSEVSRKSGLIIVSGLNLIRNKLYVHNYSIIIQPIPSIKGHRNVIELIREKNDYAPEEKILIANEGYLTHDVKNPQYQVIKMGELSYSVMICYELTDIKARALLSEATNLLVAVEYNSDTNYYSSLVESYSRDSSSYVIQVNTAQFGDSRITSPSKSEVKDIVKVKGGINDTIIVGEINLNELNHHKSSYNSDLLRMCSTKLIKTKPNRLIKQFDLLSPQQKKYLIAELKKKENKFKPLSARN